MPLHPDVEAFIRQALYSSGVPTPRSVLELGSYIMHGHDPRHLFPGAEYIGVDARPGPGVDVVGLAHKSVEDLDRTFDVVLSLQALEHDPHWDATLRAAVEALRDGGLLIVTCAGPGWGVHELDTSPTPGHYRNVAPFEVISVVMSGSADAGLSIVISFSKSINTPEHGWSRTCYWAWLEPRG